MDRGTEDQVEWLKSTPHTHTQKAFQKVNSMYLGRLGEKERGWDIGRSHRAVLAQGGD